MLTANNSVRRFSYDRWTRAGKSTVAFSVFALAALALAPLFLPATAVDRLTTLWVYVLLAVIWNLLAGFAGLVSVGQQGFFGAGAYLTLRFVEWGMQPWLALLGGAIGAGLIAIPLSFFILKLKEGEFAIATWVLAEVMRIIIMFDPIVQGDTGNSLIALNSYDPDFRRNMTYWLGLIFMAGFLFLTFKLLRSKTGGAAQAIRDDEEAARSVGVNIDRTKQIIYVLAAFGAALAGVVWLASAITFVPRTNFGIQWTVFMLFMVLVGGLKTFEGPILGAVIFFTFQELFSNYGVWYLFGLGVTAIMFALALPDGLWGWIRKKRGGDLLPMGTTLNVQAADVAERASSPG
jgi:branched-chain amino acid transport system permease protein